MPSCTLEIGGRIVARAEGGPFDAEYALFEAHEIELRSNNEPGTVREHGYQTTAELARDRLEMDGVTHALADAAAVEMGALATAYARGAEVRRVVTLLGAGELFEGRVWHASTRLYEGGWLDVTALAADCGLAGAGRILQVLHLATLLSDAAPNASVVLSTTEYTAGRRPGERTHRRVSLGSAKRMPEVIRALAEKHAARPASPPREMGPSRGELLETVRGRLATCAREASRASLVALDRALSVRDRPQKGPLSDPDLWALELQLADGDPIDAQEKIEALEKARGRQPGTAYLRGRAALLLGSEAARVVAERASSLAMSMNSFPELELLAAEAWDQAGERKRALAYARDLADNPQIDPVLRARAALIVEPPPPSAPDTVRGEEEPPPPAVRSPLPSAPDNPAEEKEEVTPVVSISAGLRASASPGAPPSRPAPVSELPETRPVTVTAAQAGLTDEEIREGWSSPPIAPTPILSIGVAALAPASASASPHVPPPPPLPPSFPLSARSVAGDIEPDHAPRHPAPPAGPERPRPPTDFEQTRPSLRPDLAEARALASASPPPPVAHVSARPPSPSELDDEEAQATVFKGGSQPPFRSEPPPPHFPATPIIPIGDSGRVEKVESLSLPPGLHGESATDVLPTSPMEARVYFTHQSRELGRRYRQRHNVELRTDLRSIEIVQRYLAEHFESGVLQGEEDALEVRLHGAFLSEVLARRFGAEWTDLGVSEVGYWAMSVPPGTTVWPIGRVIRFVTMQHRERDLVSYFLELQARAQGSKRDGS